MFIPYQYDLGFFSGNKMRHLPPAITFTIKDADLDATIKRMRFYRDNFWRHTKKYLIDLDTHFTLPSYDLFGCSQFGFGNCGRVEERNGETIFYVEIGRGVQIDFAALTIHAMSVILQHEDVTQSNREQLLDLSVRSDRQMPGWGHMLGGYIATSVVRWIASYAKENSLYSSYWSTPMHPAVIDAMRTTWRAMSGKKMTRWVQDVSGAMSQEGRFILSCFGNACDIAIYPDIPLYEDLEYIQFSCHNLDSASQQLTLLSGLAKLLELARKSNQKAVLI